MFKYGQAQIVHGALTDGDCGAHRRHGQNPSDEQIEEIQQTDEGNTPGRRPCAQRAGGSSRGFAAPESDNGRCPSG